MLKHKFRYNPAGAQDLLRQSGFCGSKEDVEWQIAEATSLLGDAFELLREYGADVAIVDQAVTREGTFERVWSLGLTEAPERLWFAVTADGAFRAWSWRPHNPRYDAGDRPTTDEVPFNPQVWFDHVTGEVLGEVIARGDGAALREFSSGGATMRRLTPLECVVRAILQARPS